MLFSADFRGAGRDQGAKSFYSQQIFTQYSVKYQHARGTAWLIGLRMGVGWNGIHRRSDAKYLMKLFHSEVVKKVRESQFA